MIVDLCGLDVHVASTNCCLNYTFYMCFVMQFNFRIFMVYFNGGMEMNNAVLKHLHVN